MGVRSNWNSKSPCQTKVSKLELSLSVDEQIGWFQVTVQDPVMVAIGNATDKLYSYNNNLYDNNIVYRRY